MTAVTLAPHRSAPWGVVVGNLVLQHVVLYSVVLVRKQRARGGGFVGWEPHSGRKQSCFFVPPLLVGKPLLKVWFARGGVWCKLSAY